MVTKSNSLWQAFAKSPILWGGAASLGFYGLIRWDVLNYQLIQRYCASHPIEYATVVMFFIGMAVLAIRAMDVIRQNSGFPESLLGAKSRAGRLAENCDALLARLQRQPAGRQGYYLVRRLREALEHVRRRSSAEGLDDELKYLADLDAARQHSAYALVRVIIWAIPILGFLGTVIGITLAIAQLAPESLENSLPQVTRGLGVAFDTTALALALSMVLMFAHFLVDRKESFLLDEVDHRATVELEGRFEQISPGPDGQLMAVRRMAETVVEVTQRLVEQQAELWRASMDAAAQRWASMGTAAGEQLQKSLSGALAESLKVFAQQLGATQQSAAEKNQQHWQQIQQVQTRQAQSLASLQDAMGRQGEVLGRAIEAAGEVTRLEDSLNRNLASLSGAKNFEQTVLSLAAAIQLLNARLMGTFPETPQVKLQGGKRPPQAA